MEQPTPQLDKLLKIINSLGVPTFFSLLMCVALWQGFSWFASDVAKPLTTGVVQTLTSVQETTKQQAEMLRTIEKSVAEQHRASEIRTKLLEQILSEQRATTEQLRNLRK